MKLLIVVLALVAVTTAATVPVDLVKLVKILRSEFEQEPQGSYKFSYETEDGSQRSEVGELKQVVDEENKPHEVLAVRGSYSYVNSEGKTETVNYYADENGFHADGDSIPKDTPRS